MMPLRVLAVALLAFSVVADVAPMDEAAPMDNTVPMDNVAPMDNVVPMDDVVPMDNVAPMGNMVPMDSPPQFCSTDAHCRTLGDLMATCEQGMCKCKTEGYSNPTATDGSMVGLCVKGGSSSEEVSVEFKFVWKDGNCAELQKVPNYEVKLKAAVEEALGRTVISIVVTCGSVHVAAKSTMTVTEYAKVDVGSVKTKMQETVAKDTDLKQTLGTTLEATAGPSAPVTPAPTDAPPMDNAAPMDHAAPADNAAPMDNAAPADNAAPMDNAAPVDSIPPMAGKTPMAAAEYCQTDKQCRTLGDSMATCEQGMCKCKTEGYSNPTVGGTTVGLCVKGGSAAEQVEVLLRIVWPDGQCAELVKVEGYEAKMRTITAEAVAKAVTSGVVGCGSVHFAGKTSMSVSEYAGLDEEAVKGKVQSAVDQDAALKASLGNVGSVSASPASVECELANAKDTALVVGKCYAMTCLDGYTANDARTACNPTTPSPDTSRDITDDDDEWSNSSIAGFTVAIFLVVALIGVAGFCIVKRRQAAAQNVTVEPPHYPKGEAEV